MRAINFALESTFVRLRQRLGLGSPPRRPDRTCCDALSGDRERLTDHKLEGLRMIFQAVQDIARNGTVIGRAQVPQSDG